MRLSFILLSFFLIHFLHGSDESIRSAGSSNFSRIEKIAYSFSKDPIDVVIPFAPKDLPTLELCLKGIKENGQKIRRIIIVSKERASESAEWFSEELFPFSKRDIALEIYHGRGGVQAAEQFLSSQNTRIGWIFQQLLKLYAPFVIPDLSPNVLILDSDVIFLKPTSFISPEGEPYFIPGTEYFISYFEHAARLLPFLHRVRSGQSGISHHMLFQRPVLEDLFQLIGKQHGMEPWKAICRCIDLKDLYVACMSEYEIYFNFIQSRSVYPVHIRPLRWELIHCLDLLSNFQRFGYTFVACPEWLRKTSGANE